MLSLALTDRTGSQHLIFNPRFDKTNVEEEDGAGDGGGRGSAYRSCCLAEGSAYRSLQLRSPFLSHHPDVHILSSVFQVSLEFPSPW